MSSETSDAGGMTCDQCGAFVYAVTRPVVEVAPNGAMKQFELREPPHLEPCGHNSSYSWTLYRDEPAGGPPQPEDTK